MAIYTDPQTGQRREVDEIVRPRTNSSSIGIVVLLIALAFAAWYFYGRVSPTVDTNTGASTVTEPVTTPASPNASPTHPAPSPNPGP